MKIFIEYRFSKNSKLCLFLLPRCSTKNFQHFVQIFQSFDRYTIHIFNVENIDRCTILDVLYIPSINIVFTSSESNRDSLRKSHSKINLFRVTFIKTVWIKIEIKIGCDTSWRILSILVSSNVYLATWGKNNRRVIFFSSSVINLHVARYTDRVIQHGSQRRKKRSKILKNCSKIANERERKAALRSRFLCPRNSIIFPGVSWPVETIFRSWRALHFACHLDRAKREN